MAATAPSFKHAAQQLNVSQSNITRQIQALEEQLGTRLFQRDNRVHALTAAGQAIAADVSQLFNELDRIIERARNLSYTEHTTLKLAVPESFCGGGYRPARLSFIVFTLTCNCILLPSLCFRNRAVELMLLPSYNMSP